MDPSRDSARLALDALNREKERQRTPPVPEPEPEAVPIKHSPSLFADYIGEYRAGAGSDKKEYNTILYYYYRPFL